MKGKKIKIGIAATLSSIVAIHEANSQPASNNNTKSNVTSKSTMSTDSVKLEKRLQELAKTEYKVKLSMGAMCYDISAPVKINYTCPICNTVTKGKYDNWLVGSIDGISTIVNQIKEIGYDVVLDKSEFCEHCSKKNITNPVLIFKIRFSDKASYHVVKSNNVSEYQCLLQFLLGNNMYKGNNGQEFGLNEHIHIVQKMTGLGSDIKK